jgi:N-acyl-D-amino-acid deacylase
MDIVIKDGKLVDFENRRFIEKNICIKNSKIYLISGSEINGDTIIDAHGAIVSPGFIDIHNHVDYNFKVHNPDPFETAKHLLLMGVTTAVGGNCGGGITDINKYFDYIQKNGAPVNYMGFVGHGELRQEVGNVDVYKTSTKAQIRQMKSIASAAMNDGAIGISFGLEYYPGATTDEVIEVCEVVNQFPGRFVSVHVRYDASRSLEGLKEMIDVGRQTNVPVQISHLNSCACFGFAKRALEMIDEAVDEGIDITADAYPYNAFSTSAGSTVFTDECFERWDVGYDSIMVAFGEYQGKRCDKELFEYIRREHPEASLIAFVMNQEEVDMVQYHPNIMISSDGNINKGCGHPRAAGTFPRALHEYTAGKRDDDLICFLEKMTKIPAKRLGLNKKGALLEGHDADIVIFNRDKIKDKSTFERPTQKPEGIDYVIVNGQIAVEKGDIMNENLGRAIKDHRQ